MSRKLYFIGICGTAMGNVALMMRDQGWEVVGSDANIYPPMSDVLRTAGIGLMEGFSENNLITAAPDLVVVGNAVGRGNQEVEYLLEHPEIKRTSLPALLHEHLLCHRQTLVVAGTHGKTTTTTLAAKLLELDGHQPGYLVGGVPRDLPSGWNPGKQGGYFVIEGDEYDTAFFDKRSKFIHYNPRGIILNNLEFDHADIFRDLADIERSFQHLLRILPASGFVVVNGDDPVLERLFPIQWGRVIRVGEGKHNDVRITHFAEDQEGSSLRFSWQGKESPEIRWKIPGLYNARNLLMAWTGSRLLSGKEPEYHDSIHKISTFQGVKRRQDVLAQKGNWIFMEDFGHHPTAVRLALESFRNRFAGRKLYAMFEPRSNTVRTSVFQDSLVDAFSVADYVGVGPVHRAHLLNENNRLDTRKLVEDLRLRGVDGEAFAEYAQMESFLKQRIAEERADALMVFFSNGSFDGIPARITK